MFFNNFDDHIRHIYWESPLPRDEVIKPLGSVDYDNLLLMKTCVLDCRRAASWMHYSRVHVEKKMYKTQEKGLICIVNKKIQ